MRDKRDGDRLGELFLIAALNAGRSVAHFLRPPSPEAEVHAQAAAGATTTLIASEESKRSEDRDLDIAKGDEPLKHENLGTLIVTAALLLSVAAGIGFVVVYWNGANIFLLGVTATLSLGSVGFALVVWSHLLMRHKEATEPRKPMEPTPKEVEAFVIDFSAGAEEVSRRGLLKWISVGIAGVFAAMCVSLVRSLGTPPGPELTDRVWKRGQRLFTSEGRPVSIHTLDVGNTVVVFPENSIGAEHAQTALVRVNEGFLHPDYHPEWAPSGYLAYSRVCTHAGCPVGLYQKQSHLLLCPCHQSSFDVLKGAVPTGGPAARALPQVPLYVDANGYLRAQGPFTQPPGPGFWFLKS